MHAPTEVQDVVARIEAALSGFSDAVRRDAFRALLCKPMRELRKWDWNDGRSVAVWVFARVPKSRLVFAYSTEGYGDPWGVLFDQEPDLLGIDAQWYLFLEDAFMSSGAWAGPVPEGIEIR